MNCKQDDLAVIVGADNDPNLGKLVTCVKFVPQITLRYPPPHGDRLVTDVWEIEPEMPAWDGRTSRFCPDRHLRPIRDPGDDAKDEMLRPLPTQLEVL